MKLRDYRQILVEHLNSISDEEFIEELFLAGIENEESSLIISRELIFNPDIEYKDITWGETIYGKVLDNVAVSFNEEAA